MKLSLVVFDHLAKLPPSPIQPDMQSSDSANSTLYPDLRWDKDTNSVVFVEGEPSEGIPWGRVLKWRKAQEEQPAEEPAAIVATCPWCGEGFTKRQALGIHKGRWCPKKPTGGE